MILIAKIKKQIFNNDQYYVFSGHCGKSVVILYQGTNPPKPLKTVDYKLIGQYKDTKHGKCFDVSGWEKVGKIPIHKSEWMTGKSIIDQ